MLIACVCVMKCKLGLPQKRGKLHLPKSHRIKGAVIQIIFLAKKCETRLCKDVLDKERDLLAHMTVVLLHMQLQIKFANRWNIWRGKPQMVRTVTVMVTPTVFLYQAWYEIKWLIYMMITTVDIIIKYCRTPVPGGRGLACNFCFTFPFQKKASTTTKFFWIPKHNNDTNSLHAFVPKYIK